MIKSSRKPRTNRSVISHNVKGERHVVVYHSRIKWRDKHVTNQLNSDESEDEEILLLSDVVKSIDELNLPPYFSGRSLVSLDAL